jgi:hypothetical protein
MIHTERATAPTEGVNSMQVFAVKVNRDDTVSVVSAEVVKETPVYYFREKMSYEDPRRSAFNYSERIEKAGAHTSARSALEAYMRRRQRDKAGALAVAGQATKQIASANELLMHLPEEPQSVGAVDPVAGVTTE